MTKKQEKPSPLTLIQPNRVTNARHDYTAVQENVLTCMIEAIQVHMSKEKSIETDLFGHPKIIITSSDIAQGNTKHYVLKQLRELRKKDIDFEYTDQKGRTVDVTTGLINSFQSIKETDLIEVEISTWAIPYLLYWGKEVGGTIFSKSIAVTLKSVYAKRLYKLCKRWENKGGFIMDLDEFKDMLMLENKYPRPSLIESKVLKPAQNQLSKYADVSFEYNLQKVKSRSYNVISFKIFSKKQKSGANTDQWYKFVYLFLCRTYPNYKSDTAQRITDQLASDSLQLRRAHKKFKDLDDEFSVGGKNTEDVIKLTKYILKNDFDLTL